MNSDQINKQEMDNGRSSWPTQSPHVPARHYLMTERLLLTIKDSAVLLSVSEKSIYRLLQRGKIRCIASIRHKRIPLSELQRFIQDNLT